VRWHIFAVAYSVDCRFTSKTDGQCRASEGRLDDDGAAGRNTEVPAHVMRMTWLSSSITEMRGEEVECGLGGGVIQIALSIVKAPE